MTKSSPKMFQYSPILKSEWDYGRNIVDPEKLTFKSNKRVWWVCKDRHSWEAVVSSRTGGNSCPYCSGRIPIEGVNDLGTVNPEIALELDDSNYQPKDLLPSSHIKVWWKCLQEHRWKSRVDYRTRGRGCPYCTNKKVLIDYNDLATTNPNIAKEMSDPSVTPEDVTAGSDKRVVWVCPSNHRWVATIYNRTAGNGCPYCNANKLLTGFNDLATVNPSLALEMDDPTISAQEVTKSANKKVWWRCSAGHRWEAYVNNRSKGIGCPKCVEHATSKIEYRLRNLLTSSSFVSYVHPDSNRRLGIEWGSRKSMVVDIYIETLEGQKVVIEYDGVFWHGNESSVTRDLKKTQALLDSSYLVVRVREGSLPHLNITHPNLLQTSVPYSLCDELLTGAVENIQDWLRGKM